MTSNTSRRHFLSTVGAGVLATASAGVFGATKPDTRPNILFCFADDWSWPQGNNVKDPQLKAPAYDRVVREGVEFKNAFVSAPSCTPSRGAILTGQWHWRLEEGGNLWSTLQKKFAVYPDLLADAGYHIGLTKKGWGPGNHAISGWEHNPAGPGYRNFDAFLAARPEGAPFCYWAGAHDPHRGYKKGSGAAAGIDPKKVKIPACLPDSVEVRSDIADYYFAVARFDAEKKSVIEKLEAMGELDNTIVVFSGDNGLPFPRCKSNLYDTGTKVPLAVRWPARVKGGRAVKDFVSLTDLAPTYLEAAGLPVPKDMTGRSLMPILTSKKSGHIDPARNHVLTGKERHTQAQKGTTQGYPCRAIRTDDFLFIRNFKPERWPAGTPEVYKDIDGSPTKTYMMEHRDDPDVKPLFDLAFGKRPGEELFDLRQYPDQLINVADNPEYAAAKKELSKQLMADLRETKDPRVLGDGDKFDNYAYVGRTSAKKPATGKARK